MSVGVEDALRSFFDAEVAAVPERPGEALAFLQLDPAAQSGVRLAAAASTLFKPELPLDRAGRWGAAAAGLSGVAFTVMAAVGLWRIGQPAPWRDEAVTMAVARRSPRQILHLAGHVDAVLTPYYLLMHLVTPAPHTLFGLRLASTLCVAAAAAALVWLGFLVAGGGAFGLRVGGFAGVVFVADPLTSRYAQEARPYALAMVLAVVSACLLTRWLRSSTRRRLALYVAVTVLLGYVQLLALMVVVAHGVCVALTRRQFGLRRWLLAWAAGGCAMTPLAMFAWQERFAMAWHTKPVAAQLHAVIDELGGNEIGFHVLLLALALGLASAYVSTRRARHDPSLALTLAGPWLLIPPALLFGWSQLNPMFSDRYLMFCIPALCLLAGLGLALTPWPVAAAIAALFANLLAPMQRAVRGSVAHNEDVRGVAEEVAGLARSGDAVVFVPGDRRVVKEAYPSDFANTADVLLDQQPAASGTIAGVEIPPSAVHAALATYPRVIMVGTATATNAGSVDHVALQVLAERYTLVERRQFLGFTLTLYARS